MNQELKSQISQLQDENPATRAMALHAIRQARDPAAMEALVWLMGDSSLWVRCTAAEALGELHIPETVPPLIEFLRLGTSLEWQQVGPPPQHPIRLHRFHRQPDPDFEQWRTQQGIHSHHEGFSMAVSARIGLQLTGIHATDALINLLNDPNPYTQHIAVNLLNHMAIRKRPSDALLLAVMEDDPIIRINAARALGKLGNVRAVRPLTSLLHDEESQVRIVAVESLGEIRDKRAIPALQAALADDEVHHAAWLALNTMQVKPDGAEG